LNLLSALPAGISTVQLVLLAVILACSALMSGLSGFGFSAIGALCLLLLPPKLVVPLLMALSTANQFMSLGQLKADLKPFKEWWPDGPTPYLLGGVVGVPIGLSILHSLPTPSLMLLFGAFLVGYAAYSMLKPESLHVSLKGGPMSSSIVGLVGGVIGGFTAFPGAAVVVWSGLRQLPKTESRSIVQPYILGMQIVSLALLAVQHPETFNARYWTLLAICVPIVLPGTLLGVRLYRNLSDINFRRVTFFLLGASGLGLLAKAVTALGLLAAAGAAASH
jgi:uncharacterized membrane protein YfcA